MVVITKNDAHYLDRAIEEVVKVLTQKRQDWATGMEVFECFDAQKDFGDDPLEFALKMCNLKITRLKSCVARNQMGTLTPKGREDYMRDLEDSIKDLAGYSLLALGILKREKDKKPEITKHAEWINPTRCECLPTKEDPLLQNCPHARQARNEQALEMLKREYEQRKQEEARKSQNSEALGVSGTP